MYLIIHAFSRHNAGDGLLVDLTLEALDKAGIHRKDCALLALDAESFSEMGTVFQAPGEPRSIASLRLFGATQNLLESWISDISGKPIGKLANLIHSAYGIIAVGGGYLVADSLVRKLGVLLNHQAQLNLAANINIPTVYMPQSIGPLHGFVGAITKNNLSKIDRVYARDNETLNEISGPNVFRCADLAVLKTAEEFAAATAVNKNTDAVIFVGRNLPASGMYKEKFFTLQKRFPGRSLAIQADVPGPRSDRHFYKSLGLEPNDTLETLLDKKNPSVVVSVRLHGAIGALLAGQPAIHLAYERKGWGAYEDLGLQEYVHDVRTFDIGKVTEQVRSLQNDPTPFWQCVETTAPLLKAQYQALVSDLKARLLDPISDRQTSLEGLSRDIPGSDLATNTGA